MTDQRQQRVPQFYLTPAGDCPYLPNRQERKVFTRLDGPAALALNNTLTQSGFRRSQTIAYKPSCDGCTACISVRIRAREFAFTHSRRRVLGRNADLIRRMVPAQATREQYALLRTYLDARHAGGGMTDISLFEYAAMVEETSVETAIFEYRTQEGELVGCVLTDLLATGVSMVYSFFHPGMAERGLGTYMILDHVRIVQTAGQDFVYLGYWIRDCAKMAYKIRFHPLEALTRAGWARVLPENAVPPHTPEA